MTIDLLLTLSANSTNLTIKFSSIRNFLMGPQRPIPGWTLIYRNALSNNQVWGLTWTRAYRKPLNRSVWLELTINSFRNRCCKHRRTWRAEWKWTTSWTLTWRTTSKSKPSRISLNSNLATSHKRTSISSVVSHLLVPLETWGTLSTRTLQTTSQNQQTDRCKLCTTQTLTTTYNSSLSTIIALWG